MGWSSHWLLLELHDPAEIVRRLGGYLGDQPLPPGDEDTRAAPGPAIGPVWNGWRLVADAHHRLVDDAELSALSRGTHLLSLWVEEHVMAAGAASWRDGREEWTITADSSGIRPTLETSGSVPAELIEPEDADSGLFNIPVSAIERLTGWRYDAGDDEPPYRPILGLPVPPPPSRSRPILRLGRRIVAGAVLGFVLAAIIDGFVSAPWSGVWTGLLVGLGAIGLPLLLARRPGRTDG